jgi:hypothetical protein
MQEYVISYQVCLGQHDINPFGPLRKGKGAKRTRKLTKTFCRYGHSSGASLQGATPEQLPVRFSTVTRIPPNVNQKQLQSCIVLTVQVTKVVVYMSAVFDLRQLYDLSYTPL